MRRISFGKQSEGLESGTIYFMSDSADLDNFEASRWFICFKDDQGPENLRDKEGKVTFPVPLSLLRRYFTNDDLIGRYRRREFLDKESVVANSNYEKFFDFFDKQLYWFREIQQQDLWDGRLVNNDLVDAQKDFFRNPKTKEILDLVGIKAPSITRPIQSVAAFLLLTSDASVFKEYVAATEFAFFCYFSSEDRKKLQIKYVKDGKYVDSFMGLTLTSSYDIPADVSADNIREWLVTILLVIMQELEKAAEGYSRKISDDFQQTLAFKYENSKKATDRLAIFKFQSSYFDFIRGKSSARAAALTAMMNAYTKSNRTLRGELNRTRDELNHTRKLNDTLNTTLQSQKGGSMFSGLASMFSRKGRDDAATEPKASAQQATLLSTLKLVLAPIAYEVFCFLYTQSGDGANPKQLLDIYELIADIFKASGNPDYPKQLKQRLNNYPEQYAAVNPKLAETISEILALSVGVEAAYDKPSELNELQRAQTLKAVCLTLHKRTNTSTQIFSDAATFFDQQIESLSAVQKPRM